MLIFDGSVFTGDFSPRGTDRLKVTEHVSQEYPEDGIKVFGIEYVDIVMVPSSQEISVPLDR